jgi:hypothetical protein
MNSQESSEDSDEGKRSSPAGPYDLALFVARSLGRWLPAVVVLLLIGGGAVYGIRELTNLRKLALDAESKAAKAEVAQVRAEGNAERAADKTRNDLLKEYSTQLEQLNERSAASVKRLQELVKTELDNIKQINEESERQNKERMDYASQQLESRQEELNKKQAELEDLRGKIQLANEEREKAQQEAAVRAAASARETSLSGYNQLKRRISEQLASDYGHIGYDVWEMLDQQLRESVVRSEAIGDTQNNSERWDTRVAISMELFRHTSEPQFLNQARDLVNLNKRAARATTASLFELRRGQSWRQQAGYAIPVVAGLLLDGSCPMEFRLRLLDTLSQILEPDFIGLLDAGIRDQVSTFAGARLVEVATKNDETACYLLDPPLRLLHQLSLQEEDGYLAEARRIAAAAGTDPPCLSHLSQLSIAPSREDR